MQESLIQLSCLKDACRRLGLRYTEHDANGNVLSVQSSCKKYQFINFSTPFNTGSVEQICKDKAFSHLLLHDAASMPRARGYFDPDYRDGYGRFKRFKNHNEILADIANTFSFPLILKRNSGARGVNVFLCKNISDARVALTKIFAKDSSDYDYVALAQEYIEPKAEYRAIVFKGEIILLYQKDASHARFSGNVSPLHHKGARAVHVTDKALIKRIQAFLAPIFRGFALVFGGMDIIKDKNGNFWLLEINTHPGFAIFIRDNGKEPIVEMYERMLGLFSHP